MIHKEFSTYFDSLNNQRFCVALGPADLANFVESSRSLPDRHFYIGGHVGLPDLELCGVNKGSGDVVFSNVRDPIERAVSLYFLMLRSPDWLPVLARGVAGRGFEYFYNYARGEGHFFNNDQCQLIAGTINYETTVCYVQENFDFLGSFSYMDKFQDELVRRIAPVVPGFRIQGGRVNEAFHVRSETHWTKRRDIAEIVSRKLASRIKRDNSADQQLVEFVENIHGGIYAPKAAGESESQVRG
ncbi:MAG TPA: hypothetical protein VFQ91_22485 [Bryobacteraceae bacterium]|nr:hypothetical protein [Bryobacteraceae bacterium]